MTKLKLDEFAKSDDDFGKSQYKRYLKLTPQQEEKIEILNNNIGQYIKYKRGNKDIYMRVMAIGARNKVQDYSGNSYYNNVRLDYIDSKIRSWEGFWTWSIDNISLIDQKDEKVLKYLELDSKLGEYFKDKVQYIDYGTSQYVSALKKFNKELGI